MTLDGIETEEAGGSCPVVVHRTRGIGQLKDLLGLHGCWVYLEGLCRWQTEDRILKVDIIKRLSGMRIQK